MDKAARYQKIRTGIETSKLKSAIEQFQELSKQFEYKGFGRLAAVYRQRYSSIQADVTKGIITDEVKRLNINRLSNDLLEIVDAMEAENWANHPNLEGVRAWLARKEYDLELKNMYHEVTLNDEKGMRLSDVYIEPFFGVHRECLPKGNYKNVRNSFVYPEAEEFSGTIHDFVKDFIANEDRNKAQTMLVYGYPGQGKTSFCKRLLHDTLEKQPIPQNVYFIRLRNIFKPHSLVGDGLAVFREYLEDAKELTLEKNALRQSLLILDGLDELKMKGNLSDEDLEKICRELIERANRYKNLKIIITSRYGYLRLHELPLKEVVVLQIKELDSHQQVSWLKRFRKFHPKATLTEDRLSAINASGNYLKELIRQPILLHMVASLKQEINIFLIKNPLSFTIIMSILKSKININSQAAKDNREEMLALLAQLDKYMKESRFQGKEHQIARARKRGKLLARERIELVLDEDSPFLELMPLAGLKGKGFGAGGTSVSGIGLVQGKLCVINSNVGTRKGGSVDYATMAKALRINDINLENKLPSINLVESGGANLPDQARCFNIGGRSFRDITNRSKMGISTISVVFGNATAGGAYVPGMSDYAIFQKQSAMVFLAGPPLVKMATNEESTAEELGGAEMHSRVSGVADYLAEDEFDGIQIARSIMQHVKVTKPHLMPTGDIPEPLYDAEELLSVVPANIKTPFDIRELIMRIVDGSEFSEFKPEYGSTVVTGWAKIHGYPVGVIGNNGVIFSESANKGAQFVQLCNKNDIPILFIHNTTGYMVGKAYEEGGIIKNGAKLINAVSNSEVPHLTLMVGNSYGAGNYGMNGRSYKPRFLFTYPNAKLGVMGGEQLAGVMEIVQRASAKAKGLEFDEEKGALLKQMLIHDAESKSTAWYSSSEIWDDGVIDPRETRNYMGMSLAIVYNQEIKGTEGYGVWRH